LNEALNWNGRKWKVIATPNPNGITTGEENVLDSVSCPSSLQCIAVGYGRTLAGAYVNEALQWNGKTWRSLSTPQPGGTSMQSDGHLDGLACPSASDCWADGGYSRAGHRYRNEALLWNGTKWTQVATPDPGSDSGGTELTSISCTKPSRCWAVGYYYNPKGVRNEALRWNGKRWSQLPTPQPGRGARTHQLYGVSCASHLDCWAVGYIFNGTGAALDQALQWNGRRWSVGYMR
jgi:hypothetical protein